MTTQTQPYGQPQPPAPKKSHTVRNVLLALVLVFVLLVGGCLALIGGAANQIDKSIKANDNRAGGANNPLTIAAGKAFEVDGFKYASGWTVGQSFGMVDIKGLKVTNERDSKDSALVEIKFWRATEVLALADCTTEPIQPNTTVRLSCSSSDHLPKKYDKITINDSF